jgi:tetratricopeptide (TPR) repeat protein
LLELESKGGNIIGRLPTNDKEYIGKQIVKTLERQILEVLERPDEVNMDGDPLTVSGFGYEKSYWPEKYRDDLKIIFDAGSFQNNDSQLAQEVVQRNKWALESLRLGHISDALSNIDKVLKEHGSDFFSCFWKSRLIVMNDSSDFQIANECASKVVQIAEKRKLRLVQAIALTHNGYANYKLGDYSQAENDLNQAIALVPSLFDAMLFRGELNLCLAEKTQNLYEKENYINKSVDSFLFIIRNRFNYYIKRTEKFQSQFKTSFDLIEAEIFNRMFKTYKAMHDHLNVTQQWGLGNLGVRLKKIPILDCDSGLLKAAYTARDIAWCHYQLLSLALNALINQLSELERVKQEQQVWLRGYALLSEYLGDYSRQCEAQFNEQEGLENEQIKTRAEQSEVINYLKSTKLKSKISNVFTVVGSIGFVFYFKSAVVIMLLVALICISGVLFHRVKSVKAKVAAQENTSNYIDEEIKNLEAQYVAQYNIFRTNHENERIGEILKHVEIDDVSILSCYKDFIIKAQEAIVADEAVSVQANTDLLNKITYFNALFEPLYRHIDQFEQYTVSAHNGQYTHKIRRLGKCDIVKKSQSTGGYFTSDISGTSTEGITGSCLMQNKSRWAAYIDFKRKP